MAMSRRSFLTMAAAGATLLAAGGALGGLALRPTTLRTPVRGLTVLTPAQVAIFLAVAERIIMPPDGGTSVVEAEVIQGIDAVLATMPARVVDELGTGLWLLENALSGAVLDQRITTFTGSSATVQDRVLRDWSQSSLELQVLVFRGLHQLITGVYWSNPVNYALIGYDGPPNLGQGRGPASPRRFDGRVTATSLEQPISAEGATDPADDTPISPHSPTGEKAP